MTLLCQHVSNWYPINGTRLIVLKDISLHVGRKQIVSILGPSGCGKSTFLRLIAGLEQPATGTIAVDDANASGTPPRLTLLAQHDELLPYRTALQNVMLPREIRGELSAASIDNSLQLMRKLGLYEFIRSFPDGLSGGMQQRCLVAMHLQLGCDLYLFDEPFSGLDLQTVESVSDILVEIKEATAASFLMVLHDITAAAALSDIIYVFSARPATIVAEHEPPLSLVRLGPPARRAHPDFDAFLLAIIRSIRASEAKVERQ